MRFSFIDDQKRLLAERMDRLDELEDEIEARAEAVTDDVRSEMHMGLSNLIEEVIEEYKIEDENGMGEVEQELQEELSEFVRNNL